MPLVGRAGMVSAKRKSEAESGTVISSLGEINRVSSREHPSD